MKPNFIEVFNKTHAKFMAASETLNKGLDNTTSQRAIATMVLITNLRAAINDRISYSDTLINTITY